MQKWRSNNQLVLGTHRLTVEDAERFARRVREAQDRLGTTVVIAPEAGARHVIGTMECPGPGWVERSGYWAPEDPSVLDIHFVSHDLPGMPMFMDMNAFGMPIVHETPLTACIRSGWLVVEVDGEPMGDPVDEELWERIV